MTVYLLIPVVSPAVPSEDTLIRISLMATHFDQIDEGC